MSDIVAIEITHHQLPLDPPFPASWDPQPRTRFPVTIVRVRDSDGRVGIGSGDVMYGFADYARYFVGQPAGDIDRHAAVLANIEFHAGRPWPLDLALWDLAGKSADRPVWRMLGGTSPRLRVYASSGVRRPITQMVEMAQRMVDAGFEALKIRFGRPSVGDDIAVVAAIREAVGDRLTLMVDCNQAWRMPWDTARPWDVDVATEVATQLEGLGVYWVEEPLHRGDYAGYAELRRRVGVKIAGGEMTRESYEFRELLDRDCLDVFQPDCVCSQGITRARAVGSPRRGLRQVVHPPHVGQRDRCAGQHAAHGGHGRGRWVAVARVPVRPARVVARASRLPAAVADHGRGRLGHAHRATGPRHRARRRRARAYYQRLSHLRLTSVASMLTAFLTHNPEDLEAYYGRALPELSAIATVVRNPLDRDLSTSELVEAAKDCDVIVAHRSTPGEAAVFTQLPGLLAFLRCAVDISTIDVDAASAAGVLVGHADKSFVPSTAELALALMLDLARNVTESTIGYRSGAQPPQQPGLQLRGRIAGIIGYGAIGSYLADMLRAIGMRVVVCDPIADAGPDGFEQLNLHQLLACSDFVLPLAASTVETANLIDADALAAMRPGTLLVNVSRGELIDEAAVAAALDSGHLGGFAMDVGSAPDQRPSPELARRPGVVATPHLGGLTPENADAQALSSVEQVQAMIAGTMPPRAVNEPEARRLQSWWKERQ